MSQPFRRRVEERSSAALARLSRVPVWLPLVAVLALTVAGLAIRGPAGAMLLLVLGALVGWLCYVSWPVLDPNARLVRLLVVAIVVGLAVWQFPRS